MQTDGGGWTLVWNNLRGGIGKEGIQTVDALRQAQEASEVDALQAQIELDTARLALVRAENRHAAAWQALAAAAAVPGLEPSRVTGNLEDGHDRERDATEGHDDPSSAIHRNVVVMTSGAA